MSRSEKVCLGSPLVSVVMSVFNGERFLAEAVESILDQSFRDFEFIVIDDGSTDGSARILEGYARRDPRVQVCQQDNQGLVCSLNRGCGLARGKYIARMDADDISVRDRLLWQVDFMEQHPGVAVVGGAIERINSSGDGLEIKRYATGDDEIKTALARNRSELPHPAVLIRREIFCSVGGYRTAFVDAEDYDLWLRMAECSQLSNLSRVVLKYRVHCAQITRTRLRQQALSVLAANAIASCKRNGGSGSPTWVGGVTPSTLAGLGIPEATQQSAIAAAHLFWVKCLSRWGQESDALSLMAEVSRTCQSECIDRWVIADTRLAMARIYWKRKRFLRSLLAASHAVITRPVMLGRPLKPLLRPVRKALAMLNRPVSASAN